MNLAFLQDIGNYDTRKVDRLDPEDSKSGVGVSTVLTSDEGFETALLADSVIPVERYDNLKQVEEGHKKWCEFAEKVKKGDTVTELLWGDEIEENVIII